MYLLSFLSGVDDVDVAAILNGGESDSDQSEPESDGWSSNDDDDEPDTGSEVLTDVDDDDDHPRKHKKTNPYEVQPFSFVPNSQGIWVAVFYTDASGKPEYHLGQVVEVFDPENGLINFIQGSRLRQDSYIWPGSPILETVQSKFVFHSRFELVSTTGRSWNVEKDKELKSLFDAYVEKYF